jgi:hypothetical protein
LTDHPDAKILRSLPGLGTVLGARVLAEFGDDRTRYVDARARRNYAGTSPITKASGTRRVVLARFARNERLFNACYLWASASLTASPGARAYYDLQRRRGKTHNQALRALANRLVAILHGCSPPSTTCCTEKGRNSKGAVRYQRYPHYGSTAFGKPQSARASGPTGAGCALGN